MARLRFGDGQYRYFRAPYPGLIERLKQALYPRYYRSPATGGEARPRPRGRTRSMSGWTRATSRADEVDRDPAPISRRGLECAASGPLRRTGISVAGGDQSKRTWGRSHRRRVPARRATSPCTVAWDRDDDPVRARIRLHDQGPAGPYRAWLVGRAHATRRLGPALRPAPHPRPGLSRRRMICRTGLSSITLL